MNNTLHVPGEGHGAMVRVWRSAADAAVPYALLAVEMAYE